MATLTRGKTFSVNEKVTNGKLHQLVDAATIAAIIRADVDQTSASIVHIASTQPTANPTPVAGHVWFDTVNGIARGYDGTDWQPLARGALYTNNSGGTVAGGSVVILDTTADAAFTTTTTANDVNVLGVTLGSTANAAKGIVITRGIVLVANVTGATSRGDYLFASTTVKKASPSATFAAGAFGRALTADSSAVAVNITPVAQVVVGADTFEFDSGREPTISNSSASPTTISFNSTFSTIPSVFVSSEHTTSILHEIISVTTTGFTVFADTASTDLHWFACTSGKFDVGGVIVETGSFGRVQSNRRIMSGVRSREKAPGIFSAVHALDPGALAARHMAIAERGWGGLTAPDNGAGRSTTFAGDTNAGTSDIHCLGLVVSQTSTVQTGNTATSDGLLTFLDDHKDLLASRALKLFSII